MTMDEWNKKNTGNVQFAQADNNNAQQGAASAYAKPAANNTGAPVSQEQQSATPAYNDTSEMSGNISLILGILSILFGLFFGGAPWIGIFMGIAGVVLGAVEKKKNKPATKKTATAGFICGIVGICTSVCVGLFCVALGIVLRTLTGLFRILF